jgi:predicted secreted protein
MLCGDLIEIKLEQMGGAGYQWYVDNLDKKHLELLSEEAKSAAEGRIGAPVLGIWRFKATKKGSTEIRMNHYRVWEGKEKAIEHFLIKLVVE